MASIGPLDTDALPDARHGWPARRRAAAGWSSGLRLSHSRLERLRAAFEREMEERRGALWMPVLFGIGVLIYFGLPREPDLPVLGTASALGIAVAIASRRRLWWFRLVVALTAVIAGMTMTKLRTEMVASPVLGGQYSGTLTGWVEELERFGPREVRLVVRVLSLEDMPAGATPRKVRISVRGAFDDVAVGVGISGLVGLQPPAAPVVPGGYDFGRELFYRGIGASGFSYGPPAIVDLGVAPLGVRLRAPIEHLRQRIGERIETALPGDTGQIANALITGDRGGISDATTDAYRVSGLTHILSISGLHMALVAGFVFAILRGVLALFPSIALRHPIKKWAAAGTLAVATFYLLLSGTDIAAQRAYIMLAVMMLAVLLDRRALSIRNIAVAAAIILILTPEAILTAGFQMSFAATLALIAGYEFVAERRGQRLAIGPTPRRTVSRIVLLWIGGILLTSILAGLATAPFGAFQFNRTQPLSLVANLAAMPLVSALVMLPAIAAIVLMPLGLEDLPLRVMDAGLSLVNAIAVQVTAWTGSAGMVAASPPIALYAACLGLLWLCLWRERWRVLGAVGLLVAVFLAGGAARPDVLIDETGTAAMVRGSDGAFRFVGRGASYESEQWLRMDADTRLPGDPSLKEGVLCDPIGCTAPLGVDGRRMVLVSNPAQLGEDCRLAAVVIVPFAAPADCAAFVVDAAMLRQGGVHALFAADGGFRVATARPNERRAWMPPLPQ